MPKQHATRHSLEKEINTFTVCFKQLQKSLLGCGSVPSKCFYNATEMFVSSKTMFFKVKSSCDFFIRDTSCESMLYK